MQVVTGIMRFVLVVVLCAIASPVWADSQTGFRKFQRELSELNHPEAREELSPEPATLPRRIDDTQDAMPPSGLLVAVQKTLATLGYDTGATDGVMGRKTRNASGGSGHSVFAKAFMDVLRDNEGVIDGLDVFAYVRKQVRLNARQVPNYANILYAGNEVGGDFLFARKLD